MFWGLQGQPISDVYFRLLTRSRDDASLYESKLWMRNRVRMMTILLSCVQIDNATFHRSPSSVDVISVLLTRCFAEVSRPCSTGLCTHFRFSEPFRLEGCSLSLEMLSLYFHPCMWMS